MYAYQTPALLFQAADTYIKFIKGGIFFMDTYVILKDLAIIIVFAKLFGILARKCKAQARPQLHCLVDRIGLN